MIGCNFRLGLRTNPYIVPYKLIELFYLRRYPHECVYALCNKLGVLHTNLVLVKIVRFLSDIVCLLRDKGLGKVNCVFHMSIHKISVGFANICQHYTVCFIKKKV